MAGRLVIATGAATRGTKQGPLRRGRELASIAGSDPRDADAERDVPGFALKFYTEEGSWDLVGNYTPVLFMRDPLKVLVSVYIK